MVCPSKLEQPANPEEKTFTPSNVGSLGVLTPNILIPALVPAQYTKKNLQKITKLYINLFLQIQASCLELGALESLPKVLFSNFYYGKSHMECYYFYQQYKDYFTIAIATRPNQLPFATFFFCGWISFCQNQYKLQHQTIKDLLSQGKFNIFFQKSFGDFRSFVEVI